MAHITRDVGLGLRFRDLRQTFVAGVPVILNRISFSGELGYGYCRPHFLLRHAAAIEEAGADLDYRWYGARALMSLRLEKGWGLGLEFSLISRRLNPALMPSSTGVVILSARRPASARTTGAARRLGR